MHDSSRAFLRLFCSVLWDITRYFVAFLILCKIIGGPYTLAFSPCSCRTLRRLWSRGTASSPSSPPTCSRPGTRRRTSWGSSCRWLSRARSCTSSSNRWRVCPKPACLQEGPPQIFAFSLRKPSFHGGRCHFSVLLTIIIVNWILETLLDGVIDLLC